MSSDFTHFDESGRPQMVDVGEKQITQRTAAARARIWMKPETRQAIENHRIQKGDVFAIAEVAGIMGAKRTAELIPLCHTIPLNKVSVQCTWLDDQAESTACLEITATVAASYRTGVEMEALTACTVSGLTVYDMCKAIDRGMRMDSVQLIFKSGGKSGTFTANEAL